MVLVDWLVSVLVGVQFNGPLKYVAEDISCSSQAKRKKCGRK
jgi:hypothetical protein